MAEAIEGGASATKGPVVVTGASGFVGSWLVMKLLHAGYTVRATVRDPGEYVCIIVLSPSSCVHRRRRWWS
jgi:bifunctional dihydroflavonol 4-reductase/flavanone 4-reductase